MQGCGADDGADAGVDFVQRADSRLVKVQSVGLAAFGPINPHTSGLTQAVAAFGEPASADMRGAACVARWPQTGLTIVFEAREGEDPCGAEARAERIVLAGRAAARAGWRTAEGIRPEMPVAAVHRIYPESHRRGARALVLVEPPAGMGAGKRPVLSVTTARGRVSRLVFPIAAG
jgi:hypothetical protein